MSMVCRQALQLLKYEGKPYKNKDVYIFGHKTIIDSRAIKTTIAKKRKTPRP
ncbi:MAG: hypothetical protein JRI88_03170 [Deltaproteobacteria bacterium]|nr:hypothetical protein [Deltaproteobacteria bacterium]MBW1941053.1 hypothetical protein [Deltaproteobacteria bacterium]